MSRPAGAAPRRSGPRTDVDVRPLVLDCAERLFAEKPPEAVSLRSVARAAGVAPAAVPYHFPTKRDLLLAVVERRSRPLVRTIHDNLVGLRDAPRAPTVRELTEAVLLPHAALLDGDPVGGLAWMRIYVHLVLDQDPIWLEMSTSEPGISPLFLDVAARALPTMGRADGLLRASIAMFSMLAALAATDQAAYGAPLGPDGLDPAFVEQLVVFTSAGLRGTPV